MACKREKKDTEFTWLMELDTFEECELYIF